MSCKTSLAREDLVQDLFNQINLKTSKEQSKSKLKFSHSKTNNQLYILS